MKATFQGLKYNTKFILESRKDNNTGKKIIENVPIIMSITFNGNRIFHNIGLRTDYKNWEDGELYSFQKKNSFNQDGISANKINTSIRTHATAIDKIFSRLESYPSITQFRNLLKEELNIPEKEIKRKESIIDFFDEYIKRKKIVVSKWRIKQLNTVKNHFENYIEEKKPNLLIDNISPAVISEFERYLKSDPEKPRSQNTISCILTRVKAFINYANQQGWTKNNPFPNYKIEKEVYGDPIFLTKDELDILFNKEIESERLARVRDIFCLQCFIGARIGDFTQLKHNNIIDNTIQYVPSKTASEKATLCKIPITKRAQSIINRYDIPGGDLVPYISGQKYNVYLKELFLKCELNRKVARLNPLTRKTEIVPLNEIASSHIARRTFIGILFKHTKNEVISSMSGHVQGSRAFRRYYGINREDREEAIKNLE